MIWSRIALTAFGLLLVGCAAPQLLALKMPQIRLAKKPVTAEASFVVEQDFTLPAENDRRELSAQTKPSLAKPRPLNRETAGLRPTQPAVTESLRPTRQKRASGSGEFPMVNTSVLMASFTEGDDQPFMLLPTEWTAETRLLPGTWSATTQFVTESASEPEPVAPAAQRGWHASRIRELPQTTDAAPASGRAKRR